MSDWQPPIKVLNESDMRALGFTDHVKKQWYLSKMVANNVSLNITIIKSTGAWEEYVLDEYFGQPLPYMQAKEKIKNQIVETIDKEIARLNTAGLMVKVDHKAYGG